MTHVVGFAEHVGEEGLDARGMRFLVLDERNVATPDRPYKRGELVVVMADRNGRARGTVLNYSWVELPIVWLERKEIG